ncbi:MAG TPA: peptide MFS transporter [Woeseiaceae bacterium]|nr:peptide MFS transporter [Woeseiaceae bacterium]
MSAVRRTFAGHPRAVFLVSSTEMWERFSYYGITALLVLYLTAPVVNGGFGWKAEDAIRLYGLYAGLAFASPAIGGWISSSLLGERRCIALGGVAIMFGHLFLGGPAYMPGLVGSVTGIPVATILDEATVAGGMVTLDPSMMLEFGRALRSVTGSGEGLSAVVLGYRAASLSFYAGLALVILGTALIKPTVSSIVGKLYEPHDRRRTFGFTLFMVGVWSGSFLANLVSGTLGERLGWHYGFMSAAAGMGLGLLTYSIFSRSLLGDIGTKPDHSGSARSWFRTVSRLTGEEQRRLGVVALLSLFTVVYSVAFYQKAGLIHLIVRDGVDRTIAGFEIPASWFLSVSTGSFLILAPSLGLLLNRIGRFPDTATSVIIGLASLAAGYVILLTAVMTTPAGAHTMPMMWVVSAYVFFGLADVFIWPPQLAAVTVLAPKSMTSFIVGLWYVTVGLGTYGAGLVGAWAQSTGPARAFTWLLLMLVAGMLAASMLRPWMRRHGQSTAAVADSPAGVDGLGEPVPKHA